MLKYDVTAKLYIDSTARRTTVLVGSFDSIEEAAKVLDGFLTVDGEEISITTREA